MDLCSWIASDLESLKMRLSGGVLQHIPLERRHERLNELTVAPTYALWHMSRHHDIAINLMLRDSQEVVVGWTERLGIDGDLWRGLAEGQDQELVDTLDPEAVEGYALDLISNTVDWLGSSDPGDLDRFPDTTAVLDSLETPHDRFGWLYNMWDGKSALFFLQWETVGHGYNHLGELMSIRNQMGLSPF